MAGFSPDQLAAFQGVQNVQGMAQPYYDTAYGQALQASSPITGGTVAQYLNPYTDWVTKQMNNVFGKQMKDTTLGLTQGAGGVGADRIAVGQADLANQQGLAAGQTYSGIYNNALQAAQADAARGLQGSALQANIGNSAQNSALQGLQALLGTGGQQQQLSQAQQQSLWNQLASQFSFGFQYPQYQAGILGSLAPAAGGTSQGQSTTTYPAPSLLSQILGGVTGGVGLAGGLGAFGGTSGGKGATTPYGITSASPGTNTYYGGSFVPTAGINFYRGGRIRRADGGALPMSGLRNAVPMRPSRPSRPVEYGDPGGRVSEAVDRINESLSGGSPVQEYQPVMASGGQVGTNPFDTSDIGAFDAPLQPRPTQFPKLDLRPQQMPGQGGSGGGSDVAGTAISTALKFLPMLLANRGGAVTEPYQHFDAGGATFDERYPTADTTLDASGMSANRGPLMPMIRNAERMRSGLERQIPSFAARRLGRMLEGFDAGGNVEPMRMSEQQMADAMRRLHEAGMLNKSAAGDFAAARLKRLGIDPQKTIGVTPKYQFGGETGQKFGDFQPYDYYGTGFTGGQPDDSIDATDITLRHQGLGQEPNWSPAQKQALAMVASGKKPEAIQAIDDNIDDSIDNSRLPPRAQPTGGEGPYSQYRYPGLARAPQEFTPYPDALKRDIGNDFSRSPWAALARAGFAIMGGQSPYAGVNIGKGALEGLKGLEEQRGEKMKEEEINLRAQQIWQQMQQHADQYKYMTPAQIENAKHQALQDALREQKEQYKQYPVGDWIYYVPQDPTGKLPTYKVNPKTGEKVMASPGEVAAAKAQEDQPGVPPRLPEGQPKPPLGSDRPKVPDNIASGGISPQAQMLGRQAAIPELKAASQAATAAQGTATMLQQTEQALSELPKSGPLAAGPFAQARGDIVRRMNTVANVFGIKDENGQPWAINPGAVGSLEELNKLTTRMGFELARTLGTREAMQIVQQATAAVPGSDNTPLGARKIISGIRASLDQTMAWQGFLEEWVNKNGSSLGAREYFNKMRPPEYWNAKAWSELVDPKDRQALVANKANAEARKAIDDKYGRGVSKYIIQQQFGTE